MFDIVEIFYAIVMVDIVDVVDVGIVDIVDIDDIVGIIDTVDIVDTVEAIWNNARLCNNQSQKRQWLNDLISIMWLRDDSASKN